MQHQQDSKFESWAVLELFGHTRIAGFVTEATIGGCSFIRVDVPEANGQLAYTRYYGNGAVFSVTPTTEEIARGLAEYCRPAPVQPYELPRLASGTVLDSPTPSPTPSPTLPWEEEKEEGEDCDWKLRRCFGDH